MLLEGTRAAAEGLGATVLDGQQTGKAGRWT